MAVGFVLWSMTSFDKQVFGICGKTIESLRRNVITYLPTWLEGLFSVTEHRSENKVVISANGKSNTYYLFGGRDESSYTLVQGITLAGVLLDEVALMPRSFVEQALARCSVAGRKFWFNCNPEGPEHWFYQEWVKEGQPQEHNALRLHFTMWDNLSLDPEVRAGYERLYTGVFYRRYIRGEWCIAEGLVYPNFDPNKHICRALPDTGLWYISCDYGTVNPFSAGLWCVADGQAVRVAECYFDSRKEGRQLTDEEYYTKLETLAGDHAIQTVVVDPSAASFIETIRRHGRFRADKANNDVLNGIRYTSTMLNTGRLLIGEGCKDILREFRAYAWDEKAARDAVLKENDHAMDDMRYFAYSILARNFRW